MDTCITWLEGFAAASIAAYLYHSRQMRPDVALLIGGGGGMFVQAALSAVRAGGVELARLYGACALSKRLDAMHARVTAVEAAAPTVSSDEEEEAEEDEDDASTKEDGEAVP